MKKLLIIVILVVPAFSFAGGGWPQPKKKGYFKLNQFWIISDQHFTSSGGIDPNATRGSYFTSLYGEYGISDRFTGILYFPFFVRVTLNEQVSGTTGDVISEGDAHNATGDIDVALKYALVYNKPIAVGLSLLLGLPTGDAEGGRDGSLQTGDGEFNQMIRLDVSRSFKIGNQYPYASAYVGFNNRTGGYSDEFHYGVEAGISLNKFIPIVRLYGINSFQNGEPNFNSEGTSLFSNNREYLAISPELSYKFSNKTGITASAGFALSGKLIFANPTYSIGVFLQL